MKRRLANVCVLLSLLVLLADLTIWVRSYCVRDIIARHAESTEPTLARSSAVMLVTARGRLAFGYSSDVQVFSAPMEARVAGLRLPKGPRISWEWLRDDPDCDGPNDRWFNRFGFGYTATRGYGITPDEMWGWIPCWFVLLLSAIAPTMWLRRHRRRRARARSGQCPVCGYDLRATPDRCPECGHAPAGVAR